MKAGRVSLVTLLVLFAIIGGIVIGAIFALSGESASSAATRFLSALATGNVKTLSEMTYLAGRSPENIEEQWTYATKVVAPYYRFQWKITNEVMVDQQNASVSVAMLRNATDPSSYEEKFGLPMMKVDGKWKVDVRGINRTMYPGLPR